ncbi:uncharacterized protein LOC142487913 [Ascaphus truei]|uniref:uncharacterized protein LOC142487913 n=1 Tax=Ascaphus truei TaxID=8439 RepID=UPI003F5AA26B
MAATNNAVKKEEKKRSQLQVAELADRQEDAENRERRNNIRVCGIPESVTDVQGFVSRWLEALLPDLPEHERMMDRCHRALRSRSLATEQPRDVIARLHYFRTRDAVFQKTKTAGACQFEDATLQLFQDLSPVTLARRRRLQPITRVLRERAIRYRWTFPFGLLVIKNGRAISIKELEEGEVFLCKVGAKEGTAASPPRERSPEPEWQKAGKQRKNNGASDPEED